MGYHHTKDVCPFIAYCVTKFETLYFAVSYFGYFFYRQYRQKKKSPKQSALQYILAPIL